MFINLITRQVVAVIALGFQAIQFPPMPGIELAFYGKICQIGPLRGLVELENRKVALNGAASRKNQSLDSQRPREDLGTSAKVDASTTEMTPLA
jgi:hypothetical protein